MRPNKIGYVLVAFFLLGGIGFWIAIPEIYIGQGWVGVSLLLAFIYYVMNRRADRAEELKRTGIRGEAQILEMTQTGVYINNQPQVKLKLRIQGEGVAAFEDERRITVPMIALGALSAGRPLTVWMSREDPKEYSIDWFGGASAGGITVESAEGAPVSLGANPEAQQAVLQALREHGVDTSSGQVDLRKMGEAREAVLEALRKHGIDAAHQVAARDPATPVEEREEPTERLMKLQELRAANLITDKEFEEHRKRILKEV